MNIAAKVVQQLSFRKRHANDAVETREDDRENEDGLVDRFPVHRLPPEIHRSHATRIGLATKIDEYVPTTIPATSAKENPCRTAPPNSSSERAVSRVKPDVRTVRLSV